MGRGLGYSLRNLQEGKENLHKLIFAFICDLRIKLRAPRMPGQPPALNYILSPAWHSKGCQDLSTPLDEELKTLTLALNLKHMNQL